jgi:hypothetical protein
VASHAAAATTSVSLTPRARGRLPAPYGGDYGFDTELEFAKSIQAGAGANPSQFVFANDLSYSGNDPLFSVLGFDNAFDPAPTGFVCIDTGSSCLATVPERTSLALLGAALGRFLVSTRAR